MIALLMMGASAQAQCLTLKKKYPAKAWQGEKVSYLNKPNGTYYSRLREEIHATDLPLIPRIENAEQKKELIIAEHIDGGEIGWLALYRNEMLAPTYDFIVVLYNENKEPMASIDLCEISNTYNCEVQDIRYDADNYLLFFNMACPSYSSEIGGKGSKLFCYHVGKEEMVWSTPYLTSNDILIFNDKYVFCSYGFTREKDYLFMIDKFTGKIYSKLPMDSDVEYIELQEKNGKELLYAIDYRESLYVYNINDQTIAPKPKTATKKAPVKRTTVSRKK